MDNLDICRIFKFSDSCSMMCYLVKKNNEICWGRYTVCDTRIIKREYPHVIQSNVDKSRFMYYYTIPFEEGDLE